MAQLRLGKTKAERELQAHMDELAILQHTERLKMIAGYDHAIEVLATVGRSITPQRSLAKQPNNH